MFLIQIAATAIIVNILARKQVNRALDPVRLIERQAQGLPLELPTYSLLIQAGSYWVGIIAGLSGIWTVA